MKEPIRPFAVLIKALLLFLLINFGYAWINPSPAAFTLVNHILPGFERFPAISKPVFDADGNINFENLIFSNLDILFSSHEIAGTPKAEGEYRVLFLGDSSMWGFYLTPEQTLVGIINQAGLKTCTGQNVRAYNLGQQGHSAMKDLLILSRSEIYNPDMFIWAFSPKAFANQSQWRLVSENPSYYRDLVMQYDLVSFIKPEESIQVQNYWDKTLWGQRQNLNLQLQIQGIAFSRYFFGTDDARTSILDDEDLVLKGNFPTGGGFLGEKKTDNYFIDNSIPFDTLRVANEIADGRPLILINEPIYIATVEENKLRFNTIYPRWAMNQFRDYMELLSEQNKWIYLDDWNLLPQNEFLDFNVHRTFQGNQHLAEILIPEILQKACK